MLLPGHLDVLCAHQQHYPPRGADSKPFPGQSVPGTREIPFDFAGCRATRPLRHVRLRTPATQCTVLTKRMPAYRRTQCVVLTFAGLSTCYGTDIAYRPTQCAVLRYAGLLYEG
eukprot:3109657-Rhodomonas_salina.3